MTPMDVMPRSTTMMVEASKDTTTTSPPSNRKRMPFGGESLGRFDPVSRDLRITGVTKHGSSWQYHIEVLDMRTTTATTNDATSMTYPITQLPMNHHHKNALDQSTRGAHTMLLPPLVRYSVQRRYRDFRRLYVQLIDTQHTELLERLPSFPDAGLLSYLRADDPKLLQFRQLQLEQFLRALDNCHETKWWKPFVRFLNPDSTQIDEWIGQQTHRPSLAVHQPVGDATTSSGNLYGPVSAPVALERSSSYVSLSCVRSPQVRFVNQKSQRIGNGMDGTHGAPAPASRSLFSPSYLSWKRRRIGGASDRQQAQQDVKMETEMEADLRGSSTYNMLSRFVSLEAPM